MGWMLACKHGKMNFYYDTCVAMCVCVCGCGVLCMCAHGGVCSEWGGDDNMHAYQTTLYIIIMHHAPALHSHLQLST